MSTETPETTKRNTARHYLREDIRDAIGRIDDANKLLPHARLSEPDELVDKLTAAREALETALGAFEEAVHA
jgi:hypothetical protein